MSIDGLLGDLCDDKVRLMEKFKLVPKQINSRFFWVRQFGNRPDHPYATHRAVTRCSPLELVFSFYDLCVAKMTYFTRNMADYHVCKFNYRKQQLEFCPVWDMEFLVQKSTGIPVDLRNLAAITDINVFREMCRWLEKQQLEKTRKGAEQLFVPELFEHEFSYNFDAP